MVHHVSIAIQTGSSLPVYQGLQLVKYTQQIHFFRDLGILMTKYCIFVLFI